MTAVARTAAAFLVAPIVGASVATLTLLSIGGAALRGFLFAALIVAFLTTFVVGIPTYLLSRSWHLQSRRAYALLGGVLGLAPAALLYFLTDAYQLPSATIFGAAAGGLAFGCMIDRDLTMRSSGPWHIKCQAGRRAHLLRMRTQRARHGISRPLSANVRQRKKHVAWGSSSRYRC